MAYTKGQTFIAFGVEAMITIRCVKCKRRIFKYKKLGKGKLWHCWKDRIVADYSVRDGDKVLCTCGNLIGIDQGKWIKLRLNNIIVQGNYGPK